MTELDRSLLQRSWSCLAARKELLVAIVFAMLSLLIFNDALIDSTQVVGAKVSDLTVQFLPWRKFGFDELRQGNLALWNPHIFGGAPYFGGFQSALLYPPNWLHLILPVGLAINWINAIHVFAAGFFTNLWCRHRGVSFGASILAGAMFMFSGPYFPHIYAGHLPHIAVMVWAPLLFLAIDLIIEKQIMRGTLLGIFVMAMFLLAGHPQYVYYTGLAAILYVTFNLLRFKNLPLGLVGCVLIVVGGTALAAIQLLSGMDAASESVRSSGVDYKFATSLSFPPENALTAVAPNVFGELPMRSSKIYELINHIEIYFGRSYLWESSLFVSITGLILAIYGSISAPIRQKRCIIVMTIICFVMALGAHTPLHKIFYDYLPGFSSFRGSSKFSYLVALFLSLLAAYGFDAVLRKQQITRTLLLVAAALLVLMMGLSIAIGSSATSGTQGTWSHLLRNAYATAKNMNDLFINIHLLDDQQFEKFAFNAGNYASNKLTISAVVLGALIAILLVSRFKIASIYLLVLLAISELFIYASSTCATITSKPELPSSWNNPIQSLPEYNRILGMNYLGNMGMWFNYDDGWGYDPGVLKRYAEFMMASQGYNPDDASQDILFHQAHFNIFPLLRIKCVLLNDPKEPIIPSPPPMALAQLIPHVRVINNRDEILATLNSRSFDPRRHVLLESEPAIKPVGSAGPGDVKILSQSTDHIELTAETKDNSILLITNAYSHGWRVRSIGPAVQDRYEIMPADWALQAIPLATGKHHLWLEYRPRAFVIGKWISIVALVGYVGAIGWYWQGSKRRDIAF